MKKTFIVMGVLLFIISPLLRAEDLPQMCLDSTDQKRVSFIEKIRSFESHLNTYRMYTYKYWETVYNPLWKSLIEKNDRFSKALNISGQIEYDRYGHQAEVYKSLADQEWNDMKKTLDNLKTESDTFSTLCPASAYENCVALPLNKIQETMTVLGTLSNKLEEEDSKISELMNKTLSDSPSDHENFGDRYQDYWINWERFYLPEFLSHIRVLQEEFELNWPQKECCSLCTKENQSVRNDPVLTQLLPDQQGSTGVGGKVVNNARLEDAFSKFEEKKNKS